MFRNPDIEAREEDFFGKMINDPSIGFQHEVPMTTACDPNSLAVRMLADYINK